MEKTTSLNKQNEQEEINGKIHFKLLTLLTWNENGMKEEESKEK